MLLFKIGMLPFTIRWFPLEIWSFPLDGYELGKFPPTPQFDLTADWPLLRTVGGQRILAAPRKQSHDNAIAEWLNAGWGSPMQ